MAEYRGRIWGVIGAPSMAVLHWNKTLFRAAGLNPEWSPRTLATMIPFPLLIVPLYGVFKSLGWIDTLKPLWVPAFFANAFKSFLMRQFSHTIPEDLS